MAVKYMINKCTPYYQGSFYFFIKKKKKIQLYLSYIGPKFKGASLHHGETGALVNYCLCPSKILSFSLGKISAIILSAV